MEYYEYMDSPIGTIKIYAKKNAVTKLEILKNKSPSYDEINEINNLKTHGDKDGELRASIAVIGKAKDELISYFDGNLENFSIKLDPAGTDFQKSVWSELLNIPYGKTICYQELAYKIGKPKACRAVGNANGKNPIPIIIPCHRVIAKNGGLGGYSSGLDIKKVLLGIEDIKLTNSK